MEPTLIGYFPKQVVATPDWLEAAGVKEVCSVSECISPGPDGWINHWAHNDTWAFDDEAAAWAVVPDGSSNAAFRMCAYRLFPVQFAGGEQRPFAISSLAVRPLSDDYRRLGYDVVSRSCGTTFECSPLSCNHAANRVKVNAHCLVDDRDEAFRLAALFSRPQEGYEPGPYFIVEVWRQEEGS